jgi:hypothetical protein
MFDRTEKSRGTSKVGLSINKDLLNKPISAVTLQGRLVPAPTELMSISDVLNSRYRPFTISDAFF